MNIYPSSAGDERKISIGDKAYFVDIRSVTPLQAEVGYNTGLLRTNSALTSLGVYGKVGVNTLTGDGNFNITSVADAQISMGQASDIDAYNVVSLNGLMGTVTAAGLVGGRLTDDNVYLNAITGGDIQIRPNGAFNIMTASGGGVAIDDSGSGNVPDAKSILDLKSTTRGLLLPRMTTAQRVAIATPTEGLTVYDTDLHKLYYYDNSSWLGITGL
jgi:hypothetical protein